MTSPSWRILLAEDNPINQKFVVGILERQGHSACVTGNGKEALAALERDSFDLALMDLEMPEMGGLEAAAVIRATERGSGRHLPILAVTSCASPDDRARCRAAGMDGHVAKPVQAATLLQAIRELLERNAAAEEKEAPEDYPDALFDYQDVLDRVDGNLLLLREITQMFLEDCPQWLADIRDSIRQGDAPRLKLVAHTLSGAAGNFSAAQARQAALALEAMGRAGNLAGAEGACAALEEAIHRLQPALCGLVEAAVH